jgi:hypothetical protein
MRAIIRERSIVIPDIERIRSVALIIDTANAHGFRKCVRNRVCESALPAAKCGLQRVVVGIQVVFSDPYSLIIVKRAVVVSVSVWIRQHRAKRNAIDVRINAQVIQVPAPVPNVAGLPESIVPDSLRHCEAVGVRLPVGDHRPGPTCQGRF